MPRKIRVRYLDHAEPTPVRFGEYREFGVAANGIPSLYVASGETRRDVSAAPLSANRSGPIRGCSCAGATDVIKESFHSCRCEDSIGYVSSVGSSRMVVECGFPELVAFGTFSRPRTGEPLRSFGRSCQLMLSSCPATQGGAEQQPIQWRRGLNNGAAAAASVSAREPWVRRTGFFREWSHQEIDGRGTQAAGDVLWSHGRSASGRRSIRLRRQRCSAGVSIRRPDSSWEYRNTRGVVMAAHAPGSLKGRANGGSQWLMRMSSK